MSTMADKRDYYEVLGVERTATEAEISRSYRKLAIKYHPDSNREDPQAVEFFKEASEAYEVLSDSEKRAAYDRFGHAGVSGAGAQFHDVEDIFQAFGGIFGELFGGMGGGGSRRQRARRGADLRCDVTLTLEEAAKGASKPVEFTRSKACEDCAATGAAPGSSRETCARCGGRGQVVQSAGILRVQTTCPSCRGAGSIVKQPCTSCRGGGYVAAKVKRDVFIPAGIDDGMRLRLTGEGEPSPDGGPPGDCYCFVRVRPHKLFQRDGKNLVLQLPITYCQAALGAEIEVPTLDGPASLEVPAGTQSGEVFRMRGRGVADPHGGRPGDLLVQTLIEVPKKLMPRQEELLRELAELEHAHVTPHRKSFLEKIRDYFTGEHDESEQED